jgi:UPF0271 protein
MTRLTTPYYTLLNADVGEGYPNDEHIIELVDIANIACGAHAGDQSTMQRTLELTAMHGKYAFAHIGYDDKENFGRVSLNYSEEQFASIFCRQLDALCDIASRLNVPLYGIKAHGALYHDLSKNTQLAKHFLYLANGYRTNFKSLWITAQAHSKFCQLAQQNNQNTLAEAFIDRRYDQQKNLLARHFPNAVINQVEEACEQAYRIATEKPIPSDSGDLITLSAQTLCVHGDTEQALHIVKQVSQQLKRPELKNDYE